MSLDTPGLDAILLWRKDYSAREKELPIGNPTSHVILFVCLLGCFIQGLIRKPRLAINTLCFPGCSQTYGNPLSSASQVLGL